MAKNSKSAASGGKRSPGGNAGDIDPSELFNPETFQTEQKSARENVEWVFDHLSVVTGPGEAPNAGAWTMLVWARQKKSEFMTIFGRIATSKQEADQRDRMRDDGREALPLVEAVCDAFDRGEDPLALPSVVVEASA